MTYEEAMEEVKKVLADAYEAAKAKEADEIAAGKVLQNNPVARQMSPCTHALAVVPGTEFVEAITLREGKHRSPAVLATGTTRYLESRRLWAVYSKVLNQYSVVRFAPVLYYQLFHFVPGVMAFVRDSMGRVLTCVRSQALAGTHVGRVSFPAGLMKPGETLDEALKRQLQDEAGLVLPESFRPEAPCYFLANNPDAPQDVYCRQFQLPQSAVQVAESWEAHGKRFVWVESHHFRAAFANDMSGVVRDYAERGIQVAPDVRFAPDAYQAAEEFLGF